MSAAADAHIPVVLLTGFLGCGKTTLLNRLLALPDMRNTLVIINEYGQAPLDHLLVTHVADQQVVELASGCVCCALRGDLAQTLRDAHWRFARAGRRQFERVVIETTGLADPTPILRTLIHDERLQSRYRLACTLTVVDALNAAGTIAQQDEAVRQIAAADRLLISKSDLASDAGTESVRALLADLNPFAPQIDLQTAVVGPALLAPLPAPSTRYRRARPASTTHDVRADSFLFDAPIPRARFDTWLETSWPALAGPGLLRMKALLEIEGLATPVAVHGMQHTLHPPESLAAWQDGRRGSTLVFITRGVSVDALHRHAEKLGTD